MFAVISEALIYVFFMCIMSTEKINVIGIKIIGNSDEIEMKNNIPIINITPLIHIN